MGFPRNWKMVHRRDENRSKTKSRTGSQAVL